MPDDVLIENVGQLKGGPAYRVTILLTYPSVGGVERSKTYSKHNSIERSWGILEQHWNGAKLVDVTTMLEWAKSMTWKGLHPAVELSQRIYQKDVSLSKETHESGGNSTRTGSRSSQVGYSDPASLVGMR